MSNSQISQPLSHDQTAFDLSPSIVSRGTSWIKYLELTFILILFIVLFRDTIFPTISSWSKKENLYSVLIVLLSFYMIWRKKQFLTNAQVESSPFLGSIITAFSCFLLIIGKLSATLIIQQISIIGVLLGITLLLLGNSYFSILLLPLTYLILAFPLFDQILNHWSFSFQLLAATLASAFLKIAGMTLYQHGQYIELPHITLEVGRMCNGINHMLALFSLSIPLASVTQETRLRKFALILFALFFAVFANGFRIAFIGIWTKYQPNAEIHGPLGTLYASSFFLVALFFLFCLAIFTGKRYIKQTFSKQPADISTINFKEKLLHISPKAIFITLFLFFITASYTYFSRPVPYYPSVNLQKLSLSVPGWSEHDTEVFNLPFENDMKGIELRRVYQNNLGNKLGLYVKYFPAQTQDAEIINHRYDWLHNNSKIIPVEIDQSHMIPVKQTRFRSGDKIYIAYFWYGLTTGIYTDRLKVKLANILSTAIFRKNNGYIAILFAESGNTAYNNNFKNSIGPFMQVAYPQFSHIFGNL